VIPPFAPGNPELISTSSGVAVLAKGLATHDCVGLDTESDGFFSYRPKLCLLQLAAPGVVALVDLLGQADLEPLWQVLGDSQRTVVLHDAEQDVTFLAREHGVTLGRIFDTAYAAGLLGMRQLGLSALLLELFGISLNKKEQRSDWARRPLTSQQLSYAALDVAHLRPLQESLRQRLLGMGRLEMAEQGFDRIRTRVLSEKPVDMEGWRSLKGAGELDAAGRGVLRALFAWRQAVAKERNAAPFRVLSPECLLELARVRPMRVADLAGVKGVPSWLRLGQSAQAFLDIVAGAPVLSEPLTGSRGRETPVNKEERGRFERLRVWRSRVAAEMGVEVGLVVSNAQLKTLAKARPTTTEELTRAVDFLPWQRERFALSLFETLQHPPVR
jgi:ribonuclease D